VYQSSILTILAIVEQSEGLDQEAGEEVPEKCKVKEVKLVLERKQSFLTDFLHDNAHLLPVLE